MNKLLTKEEMKISIQESIDATKEIDTNILKLSIDSITEHFNNFIAACIDENGKPKAPSMRDLMVAKACLPSQHSMAHKKAEK